METRQDAHHLLQDGLGQENTDRGVDGDGQFTDIPMDGGEEDSLRPRGPTIVQLPPRTSLTLPPPPPPSDMSLIPSPGDIDPDVLKELPPELQQEILLEQAAAQKRANDAAIQAALLEEATFESSSREGSLSQDDEDSALRPVSGGWVCHVCTFVNHPELAHCEMCETLCVPVRDDTDYILRDGHPYHHAAQGDSGDDEFVAKATKRLHSSSLPRSLRQIRVPATPATTSLTHKEEPTAEDLLIAATAKLQRFQSSATQSIQQAKQSILAKANSARRGSFSGLQRAKYPSTHAAAVLSGLQRDLNLKCEAGDELYESLLVRLWNAIYQDAPRSPGKRTGSTSTLPLLPRRPFERISEGWVDIGFQGPNPDTDFRGGGMLALKCLVYAFEAYPHKMLDVVSAQRPSETGGRKWYPVSVAGINLTCMIAGLLKLGNGKFDKSPETFWALFEEPSAFYQLYFHALVKMDAAWHRMNASFMEFGVVLKATRRMIVHMLDQSPESLDDLRIASEKTFIDRFVVAVSSTFLSDTENGECPDPNHTLEDDNEILVTSPKSSLASATARLGGIAAVAPLR